MSRHLAIGDIHGCNTAFERMIAFVGLRSDEIIVFLDQNGSTKLVARVPAR